MIEEILNNLELNLYEYVLKHNQFQLLINNKDCISLSKEISKERNHIITNLAKNSIPFQLISDYKIVL